MRFSVISVSQRYYSRVCSCKYCLFVVFVAYVTGGTWLCDDAWCRGLSIVKAVACHQQCLVKNYSHVLVILWFISSWVCAIFLPRCMKCRRGLVMRILSVRPFVKRVHCDKMEEISVQVFVTYERSLGLVFWEEEWLVGGAPLGEPFYLKPAPVGAKSLILNWYSLSASAVTYSEKKFN